MSEDRLPSALEVARLTRSVRCESCRYELRGLELRSRCPECGRPVWETVLDLVDPGARGLPVLRRPWMVGSGLVLFVAGVLLAVLAVAIPAAAAWIRGQDWAESVWPHQLATPAVLSAIALLVPLLLNPRATTPGRWRIRLHLLVMGGGVGGVAALFVLPRSAGMFASGLPRTHLVVAGLLSAAMIAYRQILITAGHRSRQFRTAGGDRQRVYDLVIAGWVLMAIEAVRAASPSPDVNTIARVMTAVCACMVIIGLIYLLVNTTWVFQALIHPPPPLRQLIDTPISGAEDAGG